MIYFFDTNIVLAYVRQTKIVDAIADILNLTDNNHVQISVVTAGELWSIAQQNNWDRSKRAILQDLLNSYIRINIADNELIQRYADIDAFSQNKLADRSLGTSARNMGKNDLWIAASASLAGATLITTDKDFDHLHGQYLEVVWLDPSTYK
ncbi:type II toxin-antitoxin system VapC family toxin [Spirosoma sp. KCTC 42546]|uniref:type II toxin-antitoxin system VapC family toxin n=1 Tax=Spirosoma sp. KCTC 42546 TaxID=2520506 RepID=UPI00115AAB8F|nr:PIN domain-containing protein [Spirosoma sp. KCTC 42546]QDK80426.1 type II toxin-antitoxin system VapC family toxin [Spirosoma sp. KCTC 42546]